MVDWACKNSSINKSINHILCVCVCVRAHALRSLLMVDWACKNSSINKPINLILSCVCVCVPACPEITAHGGLGL